MKIKQLTKYDVENYRNLRLEALYNNPDSFGTTYHEEITMTIDKFQERIPIDGNSFILGCSEKEQLRDFQIKKYTTFSCGAGVTARH
jgi:hypothetical protein